MTHSDPVRIGFRTCQATALLLAGSAVVSFFAGDLRPERWDSLQWFYAGIGLLLAFSLTAFASSAYRSGNGLAILVAASIGMALETSQTMERTHAAARQRAEASSLHRAALAGLQPSEPAALTGEQQQLAAAQARLATIRRESWPGEKQAAQMEAARLAALVQMQQQASIRMQQTAWARAAQSVRADDHAHAGVRLLMVLTGWTLEAAAAAFGLGLVAALQIAFWWLGQQVRMQSCQKEAEIPAVPATVLAVDSDRSDTAPVQASLEPVVQPIAAPVQHEAADTVQHEAADTVQHEAADTVQQGGNHAAAGRQPDLPGDAGRLLAWLESKGAVTIRQAVTSGPKMLRRRAALDAALAALKAAGRVQVTDGLIRVD